MSSRETILRSVRTAIESAAPPELVRDYDDHLGDPANPMGHDGLIELFVERVRDYKADVREISRAELATTIGAVLGQRSASSVVVPPDIDPKWLTTVTCAVRVDEPPIPAAELDQVSAVITASAVSIALTGTIVLDAGTAQGRRAISLIPDLHICVVPADSVVGTVPEATRLLDPRRPLTWISGPSATSDIELDRVEGVHGPRNLVVLIVR